MREEGRGDFPIHMLRKKGGGGEPCLRTDRAGTYIRTMDGVCKAHSLDSSLYFCTVIFDFFFVESVRCIKSAEIR